MIAVLEPPAYYAHAFHGPVSVQVLSLGEARSRCRTMGRFIRRVLVDEERKVLRRDSAQWPSQVAASLSAPRSGALCRVESLKWHVIAA
jgi:hypothetical protein